MCWSKKKWSFFPAFRMIILLIILVLSAGLPLIIELSPLIADLSPLLQAAPAPSDPAATGKRRRRLLSAPGQIPVFPRFVIKCESDSLRVVRRYLSCFSCRCCSCLDDTWIHGKWYLFRSVIHDIVDNPFFEWTVLLLIFASRSGCLSSQLRFSLRARTDWLTLLKWDKCSHYADFSLSLCFEDINLQDNEELKFILKIVNLVFAVLFTVEMILKWFAFGLNKYFSSVWTCLDFVIVLVRRHFYRTVRSPNSMFQVSVLSLAVEGSSNLTAFRSLRTLRALRPLRAISRWQGMKVRFIKVLLSYNVSVQHSC